MCHDGESFKAAVDERMTSRPILVLGNIASMVLTIVAFLQLLSWTIAGLLILATLTLSTLAPGGRDPGNARPPSRKSMVHAASVEMKERERAVGKTVAHTRPGPASIESKPIPRHELVKPVGPQPPPEQERTVPASPSKLGPASQESFKTVPPKIVPPKTVPSTFSPSKPTTSMPGVSKTEPSRPVTPKINPPGKPLPRADSGGSRMIGRGDYQSSDVVLDEGAEVKCTVTSSGRVNVYLLDEGNLNSLEAGEEFWSETGEEDVESAVLNFAAPEKGKWFLVVENAGSKEVSATVKIEKSASKTGPELDSTVYRQVKSSLG